MPSAGWQGIMRTSALRLDTTSCAFEATSCLVTTLSATPKAGACADALSELQQSETWQ
jgi:hypothetical protein